MIDKISQLLKQHQRILLYGLCSVVTALFEVVLGWCLLKAMPGEIVLTNSIAVVLSAVLHYLLTLKLVFEQKNNIASLLVYVISFGIGIVLQDFLIWLMYSELLQNFSERWRYLISKGTSLAIPFFALYYIRSTLNRIIKSRNK